VRNLTVITNLVAPTGNFAGIVLTGAVGTAVMRVDGTLSVSNNTTIGGTLTASNAVIWPSNYASVPLNVYGNAGTPALTVNSNGNVGIGTVSPLSLLHVNGNAFLSNNATDGDVKERSVPTMTTSQSMM
jgi:hypothetical protein